MSQGPIWGQHFLSDSRVTRRIAEVTASLPKSLIVEIGAGKGALTRHLLEQGARVTAIEIDPVLIGFLQKKFINYKNLELINSDILSLNLAKLIKDRAEGPVIVTGNLPYYITSPIMRMIFAAGNTLSYALLLMQK